MFGRLTGDSYDHALAESVNRLLKTELFRRQGLRRSLEHVEPATADWVAWWNHTHVGIATSVTSHQVEYEPSIITPMRLLRPREPKPPSLH